MPKVAKEKKPKAKKDPNAPKKALSSFMIFSKEHRSKIKEENPDASFGGIGKLLGDKWKDMSEEDKQVYVEKSALDKERYEKEMKAYKPKQEDEEEVSE